MSARVGFYNFGWVDMGVPDLDRMMDIVQVGSAAAAHDCCSRIHLWSSALSNSKAQGTSKRSVAAASTLLCQPHQDVTGSVCDLLLHACRSWTM
jgi:hypothetical protein